MGARWLGVGLATLLAVVTIALAVTGRLQLYISPSQAWFAVGMAVLALIGAVLSLTLPLGAEDDHGHTHGSTSPSTSPSTSSGQATGQATGQAIGPSTSSGTGDSRRAESADSARHLSIGPTGVTAIAGGVIASVVTVAALVLPPATLSVDLAMDRNTGTPPLFAGADDITVAADLSTFGVGDWASVFASASDPDRYVGQAVDLIGFVVDDDGSLGLGRLVITHCVIDAQPAILPVDGEAKGLTKGDWVEVTGTVTADAGGAMSIQPDKITPVDQPDDPYEY
ncbi:MAG: DUF1980 domain-containing protein [Microbacterium sp.]